MTLVSDSLRAVLGWPWGAAANARVWAYSREWMRRERLQAPVISVGNIAVGGRGKTPVVARVCQILLEEGVPPSILSRGYGGSYAAPALLVSDGSGLLAHEAPEIGDEAAMLARTLPGVAVAVARKRVDAGRLVEARCGPRVHVLDDGFQHVGLARDLDVVCVDARDVDDWPLPAGRLRERRSGVSRAHLVLLSDEDDWGWERAAERLRGWGVPTVLRLSRRVAGVVDIEGAVCPAPARPFLVAGIAHPSRFEVDARHACGAVAGIATFRDHHRFSPADVRTIEARARLAQADALLTTSKDLERLREAHLDLPLRVLTICAVIGDEPVLRNALRSAARRLEIVREPMRGSSPRSETPPSSRQSKTPRDASVLRFLHSLHSQLPGGPRP